MGLHCRRIANGIAQRLRRWTPDIYSAMAANYHLLGELHDLF